MKRLVFRTVHSMLYGIFVPVVSRLPALDRRALALYRALSVRALPPVVESPVHALGLRIAHAAGPSFTARGIAMGTYETETISLLPRLLRPGMNAVDVGAHIGFYAMLLSREAGPNGTVWAFEADPENRRYLEMNLEENGCTNVRVIGKAVGRDEGRASLLRDHRDTGSTRLQAAGPSGGDVDVTSLDGWAAESGWPPVHLVKMDIEGGETAALAGMGELVARNPGLRLIVEFNADAITGAGSTPGQFFDALQALGFDRIRRLDNRRLVSGGGAEIARLARESHWRPMNLLCSRSGQAPSTSP